MTRRLGATLALTMAMVSGAAVAPDGASPVVAAPTEIFDPTTRPLGAVTVIGDSVLLGSLIVSPTLVDQLGARGWGPIRARAGEGYRTGHVASATTWKASYWIERWRSEGWDAPNVLVNLGANDLGFCRADDPECSYLAIVHLVDAIGPDRRIWWPKVTRPANLAVPQANWNRALDRVVAEFDNVTTWDWPAVMAAGPFPSPDATHLTGDGYRLRSAMMAERFTADLARAARTGGPAALPPGDATPSRLVALDPVRLIDTRVDPPGRIPAGGVVEVDLSDHVPDGAVAAAVYLTAVEPADRGFLTAFDCAPPRPIASAVNYPASTNRGAVALAPLSDDARLCVFTRSETDLVVDLQAAFVPVGPGGSAAPDQLGFTPLDTPRRLHDTRETGRFETIEIDVGAALVWADAPDAVAVSITAIGDGAPGFVTAYPCTEKVPRVATVNHPAHGAIAGSAFAPLSPDGTLCLAVKSNPHITVDLTGTFAAGGGLAFVPVAPTRTIDTRDATGGWGPIHGRGQTIDVRVAPDSAVAVSGTLTLVDPLDPGHLRAFGCGGRPETANVNAGTGEVLANAVTTGVDDGGRLCVYARSAAQTVFDTTGWWVAPPIVSDP